MNPHNAHVSFSVKVSGAAPSWNEDDEIILQGVTYKEQNEKHFLRKGGLSIATV